MASLTGKSYSTQNDLSFDDRGGSGDGEFFDTVQDVKRDLEGWREVLLPISSLLRWDQPYFPGIIVAITSFLFLIVWLMDLSTLTTVSMACMLIGIADFAVPYVGPSITGNKQWTGDEELKFTAICEKVCCLKQDIVDSWRGLAYLRQQKAKLFFMITMGTLSVTAWIGNLLDNLFLTYLIVTFLFLLPGIRHHQVGNKYLQPLVGILNKLKVRTAKVKAS